MIFKTHSDQRHVLLEQSVFFDDRHTLYLKTVTSTDQ